MAWIVKQRKPEYVLVPRQIFKTALVGMHQQLRNMEFMTKMLKQLWFAGRICVVSTIGRIMTQRHFYGRRKGLI